MATLTENKKARHDFAILEKFEAGIALQGTEVKSCRAKNISLADAYAKIIRNELWLVNSHIAPYEQGTYNNHAPRRERKLLMHRREIRRLGQAIEAKGLTLVPLRFFLLHNKVKVELALCRGKHVGDKRETLKRKIQDLEARRAMGRR